MPNPLSRVRAGAKPKFSPTLVLERKELAAQVACAIATWSITEAQLGRLLVTIMGAQARPALAMFGALQSNAAKIATVTAAANTLLIGDELEAFQAIMPLAKTAADQRHKFAHHLWGVCDELPDALLLVDPKHSLNWQIDLNEAMAKPLMQRLGSIFDANTEFDLPKFPNDKIDVYRKSDFDTYIAETSETGKLLNFLCLAVDPRFPDVTVPLLLSSEPHFQSALSRLRQRQNKLSAQQQSPDEGGQG